MRPICQQRQMTQKRDDRGLANPEQDGKGENPAWCSLSLSGLDLEEPQTQTKQNAVGFPMRPN